jgi:L-ascorbate metabolism protein UlaG (beta-lactamase superfamily)
MKLLAGMLLLAAAGAAQSKRPSDEIRTTAGVVKITPIQHASLMLEAGDQVVYIDPAQGNYEGLPQADLILITDIHGDHMSPKTIEKIQKPKTTIFAPEAVSKTVTSATVIRNGETKQFGKWTVDAVPMYNLKRGPAAGKLYHDKGRGNGYVLTYGGKRFYFSGDTEGVPEMKALKNIDAAFVCMNLPYTMPPEEAAEAVMAFHPKVVYPYHYGKSDTGAFKKALEGTGIEVRLLDWYY